MEQRELTAAFNSVFSRAAPPSIRSYRTPTWVTLAAFRAAGDPRIPDRQAAQTIADQFLRKVQRAQGSKFSELPTEPQLRKLGVCPFWPFC